MADLCLQVVNHAHSRTGDDLLPFQFSNSSSTDDVDDHKPMMGGEIVKPTRTREDDQESVVTAPTVLSIFDDDNHTAADENDDDASCETTTSETDYCHGGDDHRSVTSYIGELQCVSFGDGGTTTQIREIPNRWEYTADEHEAMWYSRREKEVMREAAYGIAESLDYSYFQDDYGQPASTNFRGLESYTIEGSQERRLQRVKNLVAVLREQRRQRSCGEVVTNGPELFRAVCDSVSSKCQKLAYEQAKRDEKDARGGDKKKETNSSGDQSPSMMLHLTRLLRDLGASNDWGSGD